MAGSTETDKPEEDSLNTSVSTKCRPGASPLFFLIMSLACGFVGCGGGSSLDIGDVRGTVTLDGNPVKVVNVAFVPEGGGRTSNGATDDAGKYRLIYSPQYAGALAGTHRVEILVEGELGEVLAGRKQRVKLKKDFHVESGNNVIDLELRDFAVAEQVPAG